MSVISLADKRPPTHYTISLSHHWDDTLEIFVEGISDDPRSKKSAADSLRRAADTLERSTKEPL